MINQYVYTSDYSDDDDDDDWLIIFNLATKFVNFRQPPMDRAK